MRTTAPFIALLTALAVASPVVANRVAGTGGESQLKAAAEKAKKDRAAAPKAKVRITNETVRKSKGKLKTLPPSSPAVAAEETPTPVALPTTSPRLEEAMKRVSALEKELERVEGDYYGQSDPDRRERVIRVEFQLKREQLAAARAELATAREELSQPNTPE